MILNPDRSVVSSVRYRLGVTGGYCPCVPESIGDEDWKCPCKKMREEQICCCTLYVNGDEENV